MASRRVATREMALVAVSALVWLAAIAGMRPLMLPDEGRYVGVAWEMLRSGDWLTPTLDGLPYFHKPPLFYRITAAAMALFGTDEWAARMALLLGWCLLPVVVLAGALAIGHVNDVQKRGPRRCAGLGCGLTRLNARRERTAMLGST